MGRVHGMMFDDAFLSSFKVTNLKDTKRNLCDLLSACYLKIKD